MTMRRIRVARLFFVGLGAFLLSPTMACNRLFGIHPPIAESSEGGRGGVSDAGPDVAMATDGAGDAGSDLTGKACAPGSMQCDGLQPQSCGAAGQWQNVGAACSMICSGGACGGSCSPAAKRCNASQPQTCDDEGLWQNTGTSCAFACTGGTCAGTCMPTTMRCQALQPQTCDATGAWQNSGAPCPTICNGGSCALCQVGSKQCDGSQPQTCDAAGAWQATAGACPFVCDKGNCVGVCRPSAVQCSGLQPQTCDVTGAWLNTASACPFVCNGGSCTGVCRPGSIQCNGPQPQTCGPTGVWQNMGATCGACSTCSATTGTCTPTTGGTCDDGDACTRTDTCNNGTCSGANPVSCPIPDQCHTAGACNPATGTCSNPAKADNMPCNDSSGCTQTDVCKAGVCTPGPAMTCNAPDQCHTGPGTCSATTGTCVYPTRAEGFACNADNNACTQSDSCRSGVCVAGAVIACNMPPDQCRAMPGTCNMTTGACTYGNKAENTPCNFDNDACTQNDSCRTGVCTAGSRVMCPLATTCKIAGTCQPATGLCSAPTNKGTGVADSACPMLLASCQAGGCDGNGGCLPAAPGTVCAGYTCTNGSPIQGQYSTVDRRRKLCDGTLGAAACRTGNNDGCIGSRVCDPTDCKTSCVGDGDCLSGFYCAGTACSSRRAFGATCSTDHECATRVCRSNICIECTSDNYCPQSRHHCNPTTQRCEFFQGVPYSDGTPGNNPDGTPLCIPLGGPESFGEVVCSSGAPTCTNNHCVCGASGDCANGTICVNRVCKIDGRQACTANAECATGVCSQGMCTPTPDNTLPSNSPTPCRGTDAFDSSIRGGCLNFCYSGDLTGAEFCGPPR
jgi:hypothetical protein